jgi:menaquinone-dependent protoporphyrinogen oxidase
MPKRILIAHASRAGSTAAVAEVIGQVLRDGGAEVDVHPVTDITSLAGYDALVLGSAIWAGKPLPEAIRFAARQRQALSQLPVAYFIQCDLLREDTPQHREAARRYLAPLVKITHPVSVGLFAGKRDLSTMNPLVRWLLGHLFHIVEGDWRDWGQIRAWTATLGRQLAQAEPMFAGIDTRLT